jgi:hypothetical protein
MTNADFISDKSHLPGVDVQPRGKGTAERFPDCASLPKLLETCFGALRVLSVIFSAGENSLLARVALALAG